MVVDLPQGWAADEPLRTADQSRKAYEHGKYSGIIILLRDNPTDKAPQEDLVLELPQARAEEPPLRPLEESRAAYEHALQEDLVVKPREAWAKKQPQRTLKCFLLSNHRHMEQPMNTTSLRTCQSTHHVTTQKTLSISPRWPFQDVKLGSDSTKHRGDLSLEGRPGRCCVSQVEEEKWPLQLSAALRHQIRSTEVSGDDEEDWKSKSEHGTWGERLCSESLKTWTWTPSWTPEVVEPPQHQEPHLDQIRGGLIASLLRVLI
ncbi:uncharacterized protein [Bos taurus]|uniref:uncharacterized protein isoform X5 n=1 Tax=Bos taurus TaxID=9913 RepID=UPI0028CB851C|nr:uncharacterized protein LOC783947 isoform X5 [Bos taurus]